MSDERRTLPRYEDEDRREMSGFDEREVIRSEDVGDVASVLRPQVPAQTGRALEVVDFGDDAGAGGEDLSLDEMTTPFLRMLQGLSPELNPSKAEHLSGAQLGMIIDTATKEFWPGAVGLDIVVCDRSHHYGKWIPRSLDGGFRGVAQVRDPIVVSALARVGGNKFRLPRYRNDRWVAGNSQTVVDPIIDPESGDAIELVETGQLYVLYAPHGQLLAETARRALVSMTSTAMPKYTEFMSRWANWTYPQPGGGPPKPAPLWAYRYHLRTVPDSNAQGEFFNWSTRLLPEGSSSRDALLQRDDPLYAAGKSFYELIRSGKVKVDYERAEGAANDVDPPF